MQKLIASALLVSSLIAQSPLTTTFANNNGGGNGGAVYFDMTAAVGISITGIDINLSTAATTPGSIDIYSCAGSYVGNEANQAAWTLIGTGTVTSNGAGTPSTLTLAAPILLTPGTAGYAYVGVGHSFAYTNGNGTNQTYSTAELTLNAGAAVNVAFTGNPFTPRVVNTSISYVPAGANFAQKSLFGDGCYEQYASFYENFGAGTNDLSGLNMTMIFTGSGYTTVPGIATFQPTTAATALTLTDDSEVTMALTSGSIPTAGGPVTQLTVCSNGFISVASGNGTAFTPNAITAINHPQTAWYNWHDYNPAAAGSGQVKWEETPTHVYVTWDGVFSFGSTGPGSTFQYQFDKSIGSVAMIWNTIDNTGNGHVVGYSPGGTSVDPGSMDLSAALAGTFSTTATDVLPLRIDGSARPVIGTSVTMNLTNIPAGSPLGAVIYGLAQFNPGLDLTAIGMPGCFQFCSQDAVVLLIGPATSATNVFAIPNNAALSGVIVTVQGGAYNPGSIPNTLGAVSSNGVSLVLDLN